MKFRAILNSIDIFHGYLMMVIVIITLNYYVLYIMYDLQSGHERLCIDNRSWYINIESYIKI